jgi:DNA polymerase-3 subunit delta'
LCLIDSFTIQAQNALLKAIEEPDPETFFILTAQQEKAVLSTIRSRCRHFRFPLWPHGMVEKYLVQQGISSAEAKHLSALSGGSPGRAMQIHADPQILQVQRLVEETFLSIRNQKDFVSASQKLKDARNLADSILDYLEIAAITQIDRQTTLVSDNLFTQKLLGCVLTARKYRTSNVSWQAVVDMMLLTILEES